MALRRTGTPAFFPVSAHTPSALFATLDQTVSALKGDVPGGSLERLGEPSRYLTVV
jgi:hypothetical protein